MLEKSSLFLSSVALDKIEFDSRLQCYIGDVRGIPFLGVVHIVCTLFPKASRVRSVGVAFPQLFLFPLHWITHRYHIKALRSQIFWFQNSAMSSRKNGADARAKNAAQLFVACKGNPDPTGRLSIPDEMRLRGYSQDEAVNRTLQIQVRWEAKKLKSNVSTSALDVLSAANVMAALSSTIVARLASILQEENNDGTSTLSFPSPLNSLTAKLFRREQNSYFLVGTYSIST